MASRLIRDPAEWARDSGWVSRVRAERAAGRLLRLAEAVELDGTLGGDWPAELRAVAKYLAPKRRGEA